MQKRHVLVVATFLLSLLLYVDRVCISTAKQPIIDDLGLTWERNAQRVVELGQRAKRAGAARAAVQA